MEEYCIPDFNPSNLVAAYHAYIDDSGKFKSGDPFVTLCGYVSTADVWHDFSSGWSAYLFSESLPPIHMSDMMQFKGEWEEQKRAWAEKAEERRRVIFQSLAERISRALIVCVGGVVDARYFGRMKNSPFKIKARDPHYIVFQEAVLSALRQVDIYALNQSLSIILDDDEEYCFECYKLLKKLKLREPEINRRIQGICFGNDRYYPALQAADMIAYCAREEIIAKVNKTAVPEPIKGLYRIMTAKKQPRLFDAQVLDEMERITT